MFPPIYHAHHGQYVEDLPFWQHLVAQAPGAILELGCGTGRVLLPLQAAGYAITGLDNDLEMLRYLMQRIPAGQPRRIFLADMAQVHLAQQFQWILMPCNTLSTLSVEERPQVFSCVRRLLNEGGVFAASLPSPLALRQMPARGEEEVEEFLEHPDTGGVLQVSSAWKRTKQAFEVTWHYDHLRPDGMVERLSVRVRHSLDSLEVYQAELRQAGLELVQVYGDFDRSAYTAESPSLIFLAR
ncbi:MAG: class I SAM-dependent methyltransferase [Anaerolineales bacterium]|jgi:SAM-dependent methyltransferase|nr:class I SAM-dependent methyltransferase [Anaerolineales bacterium]